MARADRMLVGEVRKLSKALPALFAQWGLSADPTSGPCENNGFPEYVGYSHRFDCPVRVRPIGFDRTGSIWLACRFDVEYPRADLRWDDGLNSFHYRDIKKHLRDSAGANYCNGKFNSHIFDRLTADEVLSVWDNHLSAMIGFAGNNPPGPDQFVRGIRRSTREAIGSPC